MTGWLIVNKFLHNEKFDGLKKRFEQEAKHLTIDLKSMTNASVPIFYSEQKEEENLPDFVLFWDKDIFLADLLESKGIPMYNSGYGIALCDSKAKTYSALYKERLPIPKTIIAPMTYENIGYTNFSFLDSIERELSYPLIVKESYGSFGRQVYFIRNREELMKKTKELQGKSFLYQKYIAESHGKDIRLQVVGEQVIAAMLRISDTDFRSNLSGGGKMYPYEPTKEQCELAVKACRAVGVHFAGVDLLFGENGEMLVCEVNSNAHFINIENCTGVNTAGAILRYIKEFESTKSLESIPGRLNRNENGLDHLS